MQKLGVWGAFFGFTGVAAGAFGAHALRDRTTSEMLAVFETAARYQLIHAVALIALALSGTTLAVRSQRVIGGLWIAGVFIFSGSLYALVLSEQRMLGAITPIGGVCFLLGWGWLMAAFWRGGGAS